MLRLRTSGLSFGLTCMTTAILTNTELPVFRPGSGAGTVTAPPAPDDPWQTLHFPVLNTGTPTTTKQVTDVPSHELKPIQSSVYETVAPSSDGAVGDAYLASSPGTLSAGVAGSGNRSIELSVTPENFTQAIKETTNAGVAGSGNRSIELPVIPKRLADGFLSTKIAPSETLGTGRGGAAETGNRRMEVSVVPRSLLQKDAPSKTLGIRRSGAVETGNRRIEVSAVPRSHFSLTSAFEATQWLTLVFARNHRGAPRHTSGEDTHYTGGSRTLRIGILNFPMTCWSV
jgi:hypothetical protein